MPDAKVFGVIALKGGVGKTTLTANIGSVLAKDFGKKVLIIDANFSTPHLGLHVGLVTPDYNIHHVLNKEYSVYEAIYQHKIGFHIIPGELGAIKINPLELKQVIEPLKKIYDFIIIDSSPSLNEEMAAAMQISDEILVVSSPDYPTLSSTIHAVEVAKSKGRKIRGIIINKVRKKSFELASKDIADASEVPVLARIPDDIAVQAALAKMDPVTNYNQKIEVSKKIKGLVANLISEKEKKSFFGTKRKKSPKSKKLNKTKKTKKIKN